MSESTGEKHRIAFLSIALAVVLAMLWAVIIASFWYFFEIREQNLHGGILNWFGRFHILFIHIPIGLIFLVIAMEIFGKIPGYSSVREATPFVLWITFVGAIVSSILGFLLMAIEEYSGKAVTLHLWTGLGVVVVCLLALIFRIQQNYHAYHGALAAAALCVTAAGHYGGALVHEANYLSEYAPAKLRPFLQGGLSDGKMAASEEQSQGTETPTEQAEVPLANRLVYADLVAPMMEKTCNQCHNENKTKGDLRTDTYDLLMAGAQGADKIPVIVPGKPDNSNLMIRITLDPCDDEFMPTEGDPLTTAEVELLKLWIASGAKTDTTVAQLGDTPGIKNIAAEVAALLDHHKASKLAAAAAKAPLSEWESLPEADRQARLDAFREASAAIHLIATPVSEEDSRLQVSAINGAAEFGDEQMKIFEPVAERIAQLDLSKTQITDASLKVIGKMTSLEKLHLENTAVTDAGIAELKGLSRLNYLNLHGSKVTNGIFDTLPHLTALKNIYVWETAVDPAEARRYEKSVNLVIDTGLDLEQAAQEKRAAEEKAKAEAEAAQKAEEEKKKAAEEAAKKAAAEAAAKKAAEEASAKKAAEEAAKPKETIPAPPVPATPAPATPAPATPAPATPAPATPEPIKQ